MNIIECVDLRKEYLSGENIVNAVCEKDTQQLTKKVGGMDRQIAKLNKSIEKIASYVVER